MNVFHNKNVLITGATGLIGSNLARFLWKNSNASLFLLGRSAGKLRECFQDMLFSERIHLIESDVCDLTEDSLTQPVDFIFHAAGPMEGKVIASYPISVINPNILGTMRCLDLLDSQERIKGVRGRFILFSSVTVYGRGGDQERIVSEEDTQLSNSLDSLDACYFESKRMSEVIAKSYAKQKGVDAVIARFSTVYGYTHFLPDTAFYNFIKCGIRGDSIQIKNGNQPRRDNIYIDDAVSALAALAEKGVSGESYNVSSNGDLDNLASIVEIARLIADVLNAKGLNTKVICETDEVVSGSLSLNNLKLKQLGWSCRASLKNGIEQTVNSILDS